LRLQFNGQLAGDQSTIELIEDALNSGDYNRFRALAAFVRWSGLGLLAPALEPFSAKRGNRVEIIAGVDLGGTTPEALAYLLALPNTSTKIFRSGNSGIVYHPKIYIFEGAERWLTVVGSANLTYGGMVSNAEASLVITGKASEANPIEKYWRLFDEVQGPLDASNVSPLDADLLDSLAPQLGRPTSPSPDERGTTGSDVVPLVITGRTPPAGRPSQPTSKPTGRKPKASPTPPVTAPTAVGQDAYVELWSETGGGTQVQIPKVLFHDYFGATPATYTFVTLETPSGQTTVRLQAFANSTFRIPLHFVASVSRPAVLRFRRLGADHYDVTVVSQGQRGYTPALRRCDQQTNSGSKRFGIH
jgi:HKD family nuclease